MDNHSKPAPPVQTLTGRIRHAAQRISVETARILLKDFSADDLQALREVCCNGCKGDSYFIESECRFYCTDFIDATFTALGDVIVEIGQCQPS